jgi:predicted permease
MSMLLPDLTPDLKYTLRALRKSPGFSLVAVLTLALGIGANTAIFSLVDAVLLRPLPGIEDPGRLVSLWRMQKNDQFDGLGFPDYADYRDRNGSFSGLAAHAAAAMSFSRGTPERIVGDVVTGNYFSVLGVKPERGRLIAPADDTGPGAHPVVVLSYGLWERKFGADPNALGAKIDLNGFPFTVIGIVSQPFIGPVAGEPVDLWVPMSMLDQAIPRTVGHHFFDERAWGWLGVFGRLKPGVSPQVSMKQAEAELKGIARQLQLAYPNTNAGRTVAITRGVGLDPDDRANLSGFLGILFAGVALLLLIACANVAGLLLVRATGRQREIAVRLALGATRGRLIRQLLTEGMVLSLAGACLGLLLTPWVVHMAIALTQPSTFLRNLAPSLDARVFGFTFLAAMLTGIAFALIPALHAAKPDFATSLKQGAPGSGRRHSRLQRLLAACQVAVSFILLMGAGLLLRSMNKILSADPGFETRNVLLMSVNLTWQGYSAAQGLSFYRQLLRRLQSLPGVVSASLAMTVPPEDFSGRVSIFYPGEEPRQEVLRGHEMELGLRVDVDSVAPNYFRTLGIPLLRGRDFTERDGEAAVPRDQDGNRLTIADGKNASVTRGPSSGNRRLTTDRPLQSSIDHRQSAILNAPGVVIITHKLAEHLWPGENPIGKRISWPSIVGPPRPPLEVVGVAADSKYRSLVSDAPLLMYVPLFQNFDGRPTIVVRTASTPSGVSASVRNAIASLDQNRPVFNVITMPQQIAFSLWQQRMAASLISMFGLLALALAAIGLYGVVAHSVAQRTHEIGIRVALGASRHDVLRLVVGEGMVLALLGVAAGLAAALPLLPLARLMPGLLYGVKSNDPLTYAAIAALLGGVALAASYFPARRATRVDPVMALRHE